MDADRRTEYLFIVRIWQEPGTAESTGDEGWRGSVQHVRSGQRIIFRRLADLDDFIHTQVSRRSRPGRRPTEDTAS